MGEGAHDVPGWIDPIVIVEPVNGQLIAVVLSCIEALIHQYSAGLPVKCENGVSKDS